MTNKQILVLAAVVAAVTTMVFTPLLLSGKTPAVKPEVVVEEGPKLTHQQEIWVAALEWCESKGKNGAINPKDRDGTPSYGGFQFKPSTLEYYADMYGVEMGTTTMDYEVQYATVVQMVLHRDEINWHQQFPDCTKNKIGLPPKP